MTLWKAVKVSGWLAYEFTMYGMNLFWVLYLRWWFDGNLVWFAHLAGGLSLLFMCSSIVYFFGKAGEA